MTDHSELRRLAEALIAKPTRANWIDFGRAVKDPSRILALLDEIEQLKRERERERDKWKAYVVKPATSEIEYD